MKGTISTKILLWALYTSLAIVVLLLGSLPFMLDTYLYEFDKANMLEPGYRPFITVFLVCFALEAIWVVLELIILVRSVSSDPFTRRNVIALGRIGVAALLATATMGIKCILYFSVLTPVLAFVLLLCAMAAFVLANLFDKAVVFKEENDLTI